MEKQVNKSHYQFDKYFTKRRWISIWHQLDEVFKVNPKSVLEIGPGPGVFNKILKDNKIKVDTVDIDPELKPDFVASATELPFLDNSYDCVCAFQVLEHLPYKDSLKAFNEFVRVAKFNVIISLPDAKVLYHYSIHVPKFRILKFNIPKPTLGKKVHEFKGQHYWEINKRGYSIKKIKTDFNVVNVRLLKSYRVWEHPYHHYFIFKKEE
ncbi:MAG: class I SAM-dependent methyltransferase [bacterium]